MARKGHRPYPAQLDKLLADGERGPFSARDLFDAFDNGHRDPEGAIRQISTVLREAFGQRKLVRFDDADGKPLCDTPARGSKANGAASVLYAAPGADSPDPAHRPVDIDEVTGRACRAADDAGAQGQADRDGDDEAPADGDANSTSGPMGPPDAANLARRLLSFPAQGAVAPAWLSDAVLRSWVSMPGPVQHFSEGLDRAHGANRLALIRAGINRHHRGALRRDSVTAGSLAQLTRTSTTAWTGTAVRAIADHRGALTDDDLVALVVDPLEFYEAADVPPEVVLLFGMAVGADEHILRDIAADCTHLLDAKPDVADTLRERVDILDAEAVELRQTAKQAGKDAKEQARRADGLAEKLAALREERDRGLDAAERDHERDVQELQDRLAAAEDRAETLSSELEDVRAAEEALDALQAQHHELAAEAQALRARARLAEEAQQDADRNLQRVRELTRELESAGNVRGLPVGDPRALIAALGRPIGQAARVAAERLAAGRVADGDEALLTLAATISRLADADQPDRADDSPPADAAPAEPDDRATYTHPTEVTGATTVAPDPAGDSDGAMAPGGPAEVLARPAPEAPTQPARVARRRPRFQVVPMGGAGEVGASAILVRAPSGNTVLLDCGQRVRGEYGLDTEATFHRNLPVDAHLDAILVSHAHIDHVGSLPVLHRSVSDAQGEPVPVYMTKPTRALTRIMLEDSAKIQQYKARDRAQGAFSEYGVGVMEAAYKRHEVNELMDEHVCEVDPGKLVPIGENLVVRFLPVAHILGSCAIHLVDTSRNVSLLYTGDLGPFADPQLTLPHYPMSEMLPANVVLMESTYGRSDPNKSADGRKPRSGLHGRERAAQRLYDAATDAFAREGSLLLPSFSLGRTQELAKIIDAGRQDGALPKDAEILVAGMGERIFSVYNDFTKAGWARAEDLPRPTEMGKRLPEFDGDFEAAAVDALTEPSIVIASPAMLSSGWSRAFLTEMVDDPRHEVRLTGYMPRHSGGIPYLHRLSPGQTMNLDGTATTIQCGWDKIEGLSAHAPAGDLRAFARHMVRQGDGQTVAFGMVHGDRAAQEALANDVAAEHESASARSLVNGEQWRQET